MDAKSESELSRRTLLGGIVATGILALTPARLKAAIGYENLPFAEKKDLDFFKRICSDSTAHQRFQNVPTKEQVHSMIRVLARGDTKGTREILSSDARHGVIQMQDGGGRFVGNGTVLKVLDTRPGKKDAYRYILVTARHVAEKAKGIWTTHPTGYDIAVCEITNMKEITPVGSSEPNALAFDRRQRPVSEINGASGTVIAYNDPTQVHKRKSYPSLVSPRLSLKILEGILGIQRKVVINDEFRMIVLPMDEASGYAEGHALARGTSGAAFLGQGPRGVEYKGLIISVYEKEIDGKGDAKVKISLASVLDRELVRETIEELLNPHDKFLKAKPS